MVHSRAKQLRKLGLRMRLSAISARFWRRLCQVAATPRPTGRSRNPANRYLWTSRSGPAQAFFSIVLACLTACRAGSWGCREIFAGFGLVAGRFLLRCMRSLAISPISSRFCSLTISDEGEGSGGETLCRFGGGAGRAWEKASADVPAWAGPPGTQQRISPQSAKETGS